MKLTDNAITALEKRYFLRNGDNEIIEDVEGLWHRIAKAISDEETTEELKAHYYSEFLALLRGQNDGEFDSPDFLPNTPTIMNAGLHKGQLSACFVLPMEDTVSNRGEHLEDGIFDTLRDTALIHQSGGGTGFSAARLRPADSMVDSKQGVASGPNSFFTIYDKATEVMKQGGKRKGANMMVQRVDHPDILDFIDMKLDNGITLPKSVVEAMEEAGMDIEAAKEKLSQGVMTNFNVSVAVTDAFMEALAKDEEYELHHPTTGVTGKLRARDVWDRIASNAHRSAEPGILFIDRINSRSPYHEAIEATNPCGEQPLPPWGSCNLGSINLSNFVVDGRVDWERLGHVVRVSTRFLDNVIDANHYPTPELRDHALRYRNIGLGGMGLADMLIKLGIGYNDPQARGFAKGLQQFINQVAHEYSYELALEKGAPSGAPFGTFYDYSNPMRRNATLSTWAPTGSIAMLARCSHGCEPVYAFEQEMHRMDIVLTEYHPLYAAAKKAGCIDPEIFVDAHAVDVESHVLMQAALQEHCDSAISKTTNLHRDAEVSDVQKMYMLAWETGCKGITVYRDGSREGVLHKKDEPKMTNDLYCEECGGEVINESGCSTCLSCGLSACLIA